MSTLDRDDRRQSELHVNRVERVLAEYGGVDPDEVAHAVDINVDALFTWEYERSRDGLSRLYDKAKTSQWNGEELAWDTNVDIEQVAAIMMLTSVDRFRRLQDVPGSPLAHFGDEQWLEVGMEMQRWQLSQFLHGEQGALMCAGLITASTPWIDAKYYAATQTMDEARHVEVFARYLNEKLGGSYAMNPSLRALIDDTLTDDRWDVTYLGMQIMVEGLALAAFGAIHAVTPEPLLKQLLRYVMSDEARHVAFGVLSLQEFYEGLTAAEIRERQEFAFESAERLRNRFFMVDVWERMGVDVAAVIRLMLEHNPPEQNQFQTMLFSKIVPNCRKLGLLDAGDGWLRDRFTDLGVIQYEHHVDTSHEYETFDAVAPAGAAG